MSFETGLVSFLKADLGVSAIVVDRIYPVVLAQGALLPALVYQRISGSRFGILDGAAGLATPRLAISCYAALYTDVRNLATKVRQALDGFRGTFADGTVIGGVQILDERDIWAEAAKVFRVDIDFLFWVEE